MRKLNPHADGSVLARLGLIGVATVLASLLTWAVVFADPGPNFEDSYKTGPRFARANETITYTIVAVNTGDPVQDVVLSDSLPSGVTFVTGSCTYITETLVEHTCGPLSHMWREDFGTGDRITTTFAVVAPPGTLMVPLVNRAYLSRWESGVDQVSPQGYVPLYEMIFATTLNPVQIYMPIMARNFGAP